MAVIITAMTAKEGETMEIKTLIGSMNYFLTTDDKGVVKSGYRWRLWMCSRLIRRYIREGVWK